MTVPPALSTFSDGVSVSAFDGSRVRVVLMLDIHDGTQQEFVDAYEYMRYRVADVPGHVSDQLCQSVENPTQWLITSEWESAPPFLAWVNSEEHLEMVAPLENCVRDTHSMRYSVLRETTGAHADARAEPGQRPEPAPRPGSNVVRHALTFTVRPGSESKAAEILSGYASPEARVDDSTRLLRTSLFLHGNRVVRAVEVQGTLQTALRHVARQPEVRAVEEALNPYLEQERDLDDPKSARLFFTRAALPAVHHVSSGRPEESRVRRYALHYPVRPGAGPALARLLARQDEAAASAPASPVRAATVFHHDDLVVRLVDVAGEPDEAPAFVLALHEPAGVAEAERLLDAAAAGVDGPLTDDRTLLRLLAHTRMQPLTDRRSPAP
ncbi:SchA/CurD-like domain-containing protein [Streptomyces sp. NBC_00878]|uniref:SchA/CurD-like domain-containing protein n=1 Tax=Streptomyces sp. NBC_00878 TaxID=2975854 RepID=UPI002252EF13|nr:SchA/CurD-like domain-containing protein [Streptomyces sp. NBC_00878]MCX4911623.1 antibiotic biosynthesis monooxygenase [Streptomyces sp. NBC_00878]